MNKRNHIRKAAFAVALFVAWPAASAFASETAKTMDPVIRVMWIVLAVWLALAAYLFKIDRDLVRLEKKIDER